MIKRTVGCSVATWLWPQPALAHEGAWHLPAGVYSGAGLLLAFVLLVVLALVSLLLWQRLTRRKHELARNLEDMATSEDEARQSEATFKAVFNGVNDAIFLHDMDGAIIDVNETMLVMYGVQYQEALGLSISEDYSSRVWSVWCNSGEVSQGMKSNPFNNYIRCVRGGP